MKKLVLAVVALMAVTSPVLAFSTDELNDQYGAGVDVILFKSANPIFNKVTAEGRYDFENKELRVFGVVEVDLYRALGGQ